MEPQNGATSPNSLPAVNPGEPSTGASAPEQGGLPDESGEQQKGPHISKTTWGLMLAVAATLDILAIISVLLVVSAWVGWIIEIIGVLIFGLWFLIKSLPLMSPKSLANWGLNLLLGESFTAGFWPGFTIGILITMGLTKVKDVTGVDALQVISMVEGRGAAKKTLSTATKTEGSVVAGAETVATGATPAPKVPAGENPVTASQKEHFADPSTPTTKGATPATKTARRAPPRRQANPRDEEVVTALRNQEEASFAPDPYQEDPSVFEPETPRGVDSLPRQGSRTEEQRVPFPGAGSSSFGRGSRQGSKPFDFDVRRKEPPPETQNSIPTGATPPPNL